MKRVRILAIAALVLSALVQLTAPASGQDAPTSVLVADVSKPGVVSLYFAGRPGSTVFFDERVGSSLKRLGSRSIGAGRSVRLDDATVWRCDRLDRHFQATEVQSDGTRVNASYDVRTGSCAQRFELTAPTRVRLGSVARVRVADRWNIGGISTRLCITPAGGRAACRPLAFPRGVNVSSRSFRATTGGRWKIELRVGAARLRSAVAVGARAAPVKLAPIVLATGDSTMQGVDSYLADGLGEKARVRSDVHPGTGISRSMEWITRARRQALRVKPRTIVISIGAVEGHTMKTPGGTQAACCGEPWVLEYTRRVALMMKIYLQQGRGKVLWLALPTPRNPVLAAVTGLVNRAILSAAAGMPGVKVLRLDLLFTPRGYSDVIRYQGQDVDVRASDGVHLNAAGTSIAAQAIEDALRAGW